MEDPVAGERHPCFLEGFIRDLKVKWAVSNVTMKIHIYGQWKTPLVTFVTATSFFSSSVSISISLNHATKFFVHIRETRKASEHGSGDVLERRVFTSATFAHSCTGARRKSWVSTTLTSGSLASRITWMEMELTLLSVRKSSFEVDQHWSNSLSICNVDWWCVFSQWRLWGSKEISDKSARRETHSNKMRE